MGLDRLARMDPLRDLRLVFNAPAGYAFVLDGETLGGCVLDGTRLVRFEVAPDQRRRGIGRRAMALLLELLAPGSRLEIEVPAGDFAAEGFARAMGFGVRAVVFDRQVAPSDETVVLFRPVGQKELELIQATEMRAFPPRLPDQPIFYPVTTLEYARIIAKDWNVRDPASGHVGYVLRFRVLREFLDRHPPREAGGRDLVEHWIPAEELPAFNAAIVGPIEVVESFGA